MFYSPSIFCHLVFRINSCTKWIFEKAYGFIVPELGDENVFIHINELEKSGYKGIHIGTKLSYEPNTNKKGKTQAIKIKKIG